MKSLTAVRPYYSDKGASTAFYDLITDKDQAVSGDVDLYAGLIAPGGSVLELGSGTGRVAIALASRGFEVTGLDIAPAMLAQAEAKRGVLASEVADRLRFVRGDMTSFVLGETYDLICATYFALAHLPVGAAWKNTFRAISKHLAPGGVVAVHLPVAAKMGRAPPSPDQPVFLEPTSDGGTLSLYVAEQTMRPNIGRMDLVLRYVSTSPGERRESLERLTLYDGDPAPFAAAVGLFPSGPVADLGGMGGVHLFRCD